MLWIEVYNRAHLIYALCFLDTANKPTGKCSFDYPEYPLMQRAGWGGQLRSLCKGWLGRWCSWGACDDPRSIWVPWACPEHHGAGTAELPSLLPAQSRASHGDSAPCSAPSSPEQGGCSVACLIYSCPKAGRGQGWDTATGPWEAWEGCFLFLGCPALLSRQEVPLSRARQHGGSRCDRRLAAAACSPERPAD